MLIELASKQRAVLATQRVADVTWFELLEAFLGRGWLAALTNALHAGSLVHHLPHLTFKHPCGRPGRARCHETLIIYKPSVRNFTTQENLYY